MYMRILLISYFFPPYNTIGAVRTGKTAKYLFRFGHDIRVISAKDQLLDESLPVEIQESNVYYTKWYNINGWIKILLKENKIKRNGYDLGNTFNNSFLRKLYKTIFCLPDSQIGWYPYAIKKAKELLKDWKPDIIYASAMPFTSLIIAKKLKSIFNIPYVAELRDLWVDNHYYADNYLKIRKHLENKIENKVLSNANHIITVSEPLADTLISKYGNKVSVILNGYDEDDFPKDTNYNIFDKNYLNIVYTGSIYPLRRDPKPLFESLKILDNSNRKKIKIYFYGKKMSYINELAKKYEILNSIVIKPQVKYKESLIIQRNADILLLLLWNDEKEKGVYTGKLFEYIGARRPILAIGMKNNCAGELIAKEKIGHIANNPEEIKDIIINYLQIKEKLKIIEDVQMNNRNIYTRYEQCKKLESIIKNVIN